MKRKIKNVFFIILSIAFLLISVAMVTRIVEHVALPCTNSFPVSLDWLPIEYPRDSEKFEVKMENKQIIYSFKQNEVTAVITKQFETSNSYKIVYKAFHWTADDNKLTIFLKKNLLNLITTIFILIVSMSGVIILIKKIK